MHQVKLITEKQMNEVLEQRQTGLFWTKDSRTGKFLAVKNLESKTSIGKFKELSNCIDWLKEKVN